MAGMWEGELTQGNWAKFKYRMNLQAVGNGVAGKSYIEDNRGKTGEMTLEGTVRGANLDFREVKITKADNVWLLKAGLLKFSSGSRGTLSGTWWTSSSRSKRPEGTIVLRRPKGHVQQGSGSGGRLKPVPKPVGGWLRPVKAAASSVCPSGGGHSFEPSRAVDGDPKTAWASKREGANAWLKVDLDQPRTIDGMRIVNGWAYDHRQWRHNARIRQALLEFDDGSAVTIGLKDSMEPQEKDFTARKTKSVKLTVFATYSGSSRDTCVSEIMFRQGAPVSVTDDSRSGTGGSGGSTVRRTRRGTLPVNWLQGVWESDKIAYLELNVQGNKITGGVYRNRGAAERGLVVRGSSDRPGQATYTWVAGGNTGQARIEHQHDGTYKQTVNWNGTRKSLPIRKIPNSVDASWAAGRWQSENLEFLDFELKGNRIVGGRFKNRGEEEQDIIAGFVYGPERLVYAFASGGGGTATIERKGDGTCVQTVRSGDTSSSFPIRKVTTEPQSPATETEATDLSVPFADVVNRSRFQTADFALLDIKVDDKRVRGGLIVLRSGEKGTIVSGYVRDDTVVYQYQVSGKRRTGVLKRLADGSLHSKTDVQGSSTASWVKRL